MPNRTPAQARAKLDELPFMNSAQERAVRAEVERIIAERTAPMVAGASANLRSMDREAGDYVKAAADHLQAVNDLAARMKRREVSARDARKGRDKLRREEMKLSQLLDSIKGSYERELYVRDHPEDVLNSLYTGCRRARHHPDPDSPKRQGRCPRGHWPLADA
jgi:hypothetical protein